MVPSLNKLPVVGQTPFDSKGAPPQETPTPLAPLDDKKPPMPLQVYESNRPFFGSAPVGGLELLRSKILVVFVLCAVWFIPATVKLIEQSADVQGMLASSFSCFVPK